MKDETGVLTCDYCKGQTGEFITSTGNHVSCTRDSIFRVRISKLEVVAEAARDISKWLKRNNMQDTAHGRFLAEALQALDSQTETAPTL